MTRHSQPLPSKISLFKKTFRQAHAASKRLVTKSVSSRDGRLSELMRFTLKNQTTSDYPFIFKYAFCRREEDGKRIQNLAGAVHLLQSSGFVTDDIFDQTPKRYGDKAVHIKYGVDYAIIASQLMQSIALETISAELHAGSFANECLVLQIFNQIIRELFVGQYLDVYNSSDIHVSLKDYYRVISLAVGRYYSHVAKCGALLANKSPSEVKAITKFGYHYGMAVFITDDILDITEKPKLAGMIAGSDLMNRRMRLPVIFALKQADKKGSAYLKNFLQGRRNAGAREYDAIAKVVIESGALESCKAVAQRHVAAALKSLSGEKKGFSTDMLRWLAETLMAAQGLED